MLGETTLIEDLRCSGALRLVFPRTSPQLTAIAVNAAGGLTSGDKFTLQASAGHCSDLVLSTQAAERAYRAPYGPAMIETQLEVAAGARLRWLPQELILFDGCDLSRRLRVNLDVDARLLLVEPLVFGRIAMGETLKSARLRDRVEIYRCGTPIYLDGMLFTGDVTDCLARPAVAAGGRAIASIVYVAPDAEGRRDLLRASLPECAGVSLLQSDMLVLRLVAQDGFELRKALLPTLQQLSDDTLPKTWRL
ncbi:MAG: urease accessory protein UreD [Pseudomonadota bacterium]